MNELDVAGLLRTYSEKCANAYSTKHLKQLVRDLKSELSHQEINKMKVMDKNEY